MIERRAEAFEEGIQLTVLGYRLQPGMPAPEFELESLGPGEGMPVPIRLGDSQGQVRLLNVINSIDTPVCQCETRRWSQELGSEVLVYTVSMDLPFALARWNEQEKIALRGLSAHKSEQFGRDYGVLLKEWRLLQRAVFVIDRQGQITHAEYVADQMQEPDYEAALAAVRAAQ